MVCFGDENGSACTLAFLTILSYHYNMMYMKYFDKMFISMNLHVFICWCKKP